MAPARHYAQGQGVSVSSGLLRAQEIRLLTAVGVVSIFTNLLMLTGPIFMLQVYDRVLSSRSEATLLVLLAIVAFLYLIFGLLDHARARIAARTGAGLQDTLDVPVFRAALDDNGALLGAQSPARAPQELSVVQRMMASPVFLALFDIPWVPLFILVISLLHPLLGLLSVASVVLLTLISLVSMRVNREKIDTAHRDAVSAEQLSLQIATEARQMQALGMLSHALARWQVARRRALSHGMASNDGVGGFSATSRTLRLFLQSAVLALGAWLVLQNQLTPGGMIAATIILGRALAPIDQLIGGWSQLQGARAAYGRLKTLLAEARPHAARTRLPAPKGHLTVRNLTLQRPGSTGVEGLILRDVSLTVAPGAALGVIGPSGAGKSSLAEAVAGIYTPLRGEIRLDGALIDHYDPTQFGRAIG